MTMNKWIDRYPYVKALLQQKGDALLYATPEVLDAAAQVELPQSSGPWLSGESIPWDGSLGPFDTWPSRSSDSSDSSATTDGFTFDSIGMDDVVRRRVRSDASRPDCIILDDADAQLGSSG